MFLFLYILLFIKKKEKYKINYYNFIRPTANN